MLTDQTTFAADIHDAAVLKAALAVIGTMFPRRLDRRIGDAVETLNTVLADIEARIHTHGMSK
jgi:hypothetical protein